MSDNTAVLADPVTPAPPMKVSAPGRRRPTTRSRASLTARIVAAIALCAVLMFPLYWMVVVALSTRAELRGGGLRMWPRSLMLANFERVLDSFPVQ